MKHPMPMLVPTRYRPLAPQSPAKIAKRPVPLPLSAVRVVVPINLYLAYERKKLLYDQVIKSNSSISETRL
jgi:hypothetical protein